MKYLKDLISGVIALAITSCVSTGIPPKNPEQKSTVRMRFQNMLGLKLYHAGCSFQNLGGVERMCQYSKHNPADLVFQIGPSFTELLGDNQTFQEIQSKRKALWKIWEIQKVDFYSVDPKDLIPNLKSFLDSHQHSSIQLISTNLIKPNGLYLFTPYISKDIFGKKITLVSFSEASEKQSKTWQTEDVVTAFEKIQKQVEGHTDIFYVLGSLSTKSREQISKLARKPVLFLGGGLEENNSVRLDPRGPRDFQARAASFGRGFGEIAVGNFEKDLWGKEPQANLAGLNHSFWSYLLEPQEVKFNECSQVLDTTKPQPLPTEALK